MVLFISEFASDRSLPILTIVPYAVVNVVQGKRYRYAHSIGLAIYSNITHVGLRLRIFAISCRPFFTFSIDNHNITFMEADGIEHDPVTVQNVDVYAGESFEPV